MAKQNKIKGQTKGSAERKRLLKSTRYFCLQNSAQKTDLASGNLVIKQLIKFKASQKNAKIKLEVYEKTIKGEWHVNKGKDRPVFVIEGQINDALLLEVKSLSQDDSVYKQRKNKLGEELWLSATVCLEDIEGNPCPGNNNLTFMLPAAEYDDTWELGLKCYLEDKHLPGVDTGTKLITWSSCDQMLTDINRIDRREDFPKHKLQNGKPEMVIIHSMCAKAAFESGEMFSIDKNVTLLNNIPYKNRIIRLSAHFFIGRGGELYHGVDVNKRASHAGGKNTRTIGIELLGYADQFRVEVETNYKTILSQWDKSKKNLLNSEKAMAALISKQAKSKPNPKLAEQIEKCAKRIQQLKSTTLAREKKKEIYEKQLAKKQNLVLAGKDVPEIFTFTANQYESLGKLLAVLYKRFQFPEVASHRYVDVPVKNRKVSKNQDQIAEQKKIRGTLNKSLKKAKGELAKLKGDALKAKKAEVAAIEKKINKSLATSRSLIKTNRALNAGKKTDPGVYFEWGNIEKYLPSGKLTGSEAGQGSVYTID